MVEDSEWIHCWYSTLLMSLTEAAVVASWDKNWNKNDNKIYRALKQFFIYATCVPNGSTGNGNVG